MIVTSVQTGMMMQSTKISLSQTHAIGIAPDVLEHLTDVFGRWAGIWYRLAVHASSVQCLRYEDRP